MSTRLSGSIDITRLKLPYLNMPFVTCYALIQKLEEFALLLYGDMARVCCRLRRLLLSRSVFFRLGLYIAKLLQLMSISIGYGFYTLYQSLECKACKFYFLACLSSGFFDTSSLFLVKCSNFNKSMSSPFQYCVRPL